MWLAQPTQYWPRTDCHVRGLLSYWTIPPRFLSVTSTLAPAADLPFPNHQNAVALNPDPYPSRPCQLFDMLRDGSRYNPLVIHEDNNHDIYVQGLSEFMVRTAEECLSLLRIGEENRAIRETSMNQVMATILT